MIDTKTEVKLYVESEARDETVAIHEGLMYMDCPECGEKNKLMIGTFDDGGYWYKCLRASCDTHGSFGTTYVHKRQAPAKKDRNTYPVAAIDALTTANRKWFKYDYGLSGIALDNLCAGTYTDNNFHHKRFVFPIRRPSGEITGYLGRTFDKDVKTKALARPYDTHSPMIAWYGLDYMYAIGPGGDLIIVEDQISAARIGQYRPCVALLGTSLSHEALAEIMSNWQGRIRIALDNDATKLAVLMTKRVPRSYLYPLQRDVKDMSEIEFKNFIGFGEH